jgi:plasmid replication initiation protein
MSKMLEIPFSDGERSGTIVKSNAFINGRYKLNLMQMRIILSICQLTSKDDPIGKTYAVPVKHVLGRSTGANYREVETNAIELQKKVIKLPKRIGARKTSFELVNILSYTHYPADDSGLIYFRFDPAMKDHFLSLKDKYTKYLLEYVWNFKCVHSIRIYELLKENYNQGKDSREFEIRDLKAILALEDSYEEWYEFKRSVIVKTQKEINKYSDIRFEFDPIKQGRTVVAICFYIFGNDDSKNKPAKNKAVKEAFGVRVFDGALRKKLEEQYGKAIVNFAVEQTLKRAEVKNPEAYVRDGLKKGYFDEGFVNFTQQQQKQAQQQQQAQQHEQLAQKAEQIREEYGKFWRMRCLEYARNEQLAQYKEAFRKQYQHDPKMVQVISELENGSLSESSAVKIGNFIMQLVGQAEEKDVRHYAMHKYGVDLSLI